MITLNTRESQHLVRCAYGAGLTFSSVRLCPSVIAVNRACSCQIYCHFLCYNNTVDFIGQCLPHPRRSGSGFDALMCSSLSVRDCCQSLVKLSNSLSRCLPSKLLLLEFLRRGCETGCSLLFVIVRWVLNMSPLCSSVPHLLVVSRGRCYIHCYIFTMKEL
jgi:hypothetical protein